LQQVFNRSIKQALDLYNGAVNSESDNDDNIENESHKYLNAVLLNGSSVKTTQYLINIETNPQNASSGLALSVGNVGRLADIRNGPDCLRHVLPVAVLVQREGDVRRRTEVDRSNSGRTQADVEIVDDRSEELADVVHTLPLDTARRVDNEHEIDDTRATCCRQVHYVSMGACSADLWK